MAESTLSVGWLELQALVGHFLGYGSTIADWSSVQTAEIGRIIQSGVRNVYYPTPENPEDKGYVWSFLKPTTTLAVVSGTEDYDLPDDFAGLTGEIHYPSAEFRQSMVRIPLAEMLRMRSADDSSNPPIYFAIRPKTSDQTDGQRWELLLWPNPSDSWTMSYSYEAYSGSLTDTRDYPLGGMKLSELYIESCLSIAEQRANDEIGLHSQKYSMLLTDAIARDRKRGGRILGHMGHREEPPDEWRRGYTGGTYPITYDGNPI